LEKYFDLYRVTLKVVQIFQPVIEPPQLVTIEPIIPCTNVNIFQEKGATSFSKKVWESLNFMKKGLKKSS
jgi:hypothetical protein